MSFLHFRQSTNPAAVQQSRSAVESFGRGMQTLFQLPLLQAQAAEQAQDSGMKRNLMESQIAGHVAQEALYRSQTRQHDTETNALAGAPDVLTTVLASRAGTDVPTFNRWRDSVRTGVQPTTSATGDPETDAAIGIPTKPALDPGLVQAMAREYGRMAPGFINPKGLKVDELAQASGAYQKQDATAGVMSGGLDPQRVAQAFFSTSGHAPFSFHEFGTGNNLTGAVDDSSGPAVRFGNLRTQQTAAERAQELQRRAAAGASGEQGRLAAARRERVAGGYDRPVTVLDEDSGEAQITRMPTGAEPVTVGVAPRKSTGADATNAKERNRVVRDVERELPGATDREIQVEVDRRMVRRNLQARAGMTAPQAAAAAPPPAHGVDMAKAAEIRERVRSGQLTREQGIAQLRALGFK